MNVSDLLIRNASVYADRLAIIDTWKKRTRSTTYAALEEATSHVAGIFRHQGLGPGDRVLVLTPMSKELYVTLLALFRIGAVAMFIDISFGRKHIEACCKRYPPTGFVASPKAHLLRLVAPLLRRIPCKFSTGVPVPNTCTFNPAFETERFSEVYPAQEDSPALLTFTSGSTGLPKAAMRTHGFLLAQHDALSETMRLKSSDMNLTSLPIVVLSNLAAGAVSLLPYADLRRPGAIRPEPVYAQMAAHRPQIITAPPAFIERIVDYCGKTGHGLPGVEKVFCGGAPVFPALLDKLHGIAPETEVVAVYGSTEAEPIAALEVSKMSPEDKKGMERGKGLLAGAPVDSIQIRVLRDQWGEAIGTLSASSLETQCVALGAPGEIVVCGHHVLNGYVDGEGDHEIKISVDEEVWHRTGDAGYLDERGRLWLLGRCAEAIRDERGVLYPFPVECSAQQFPEIRRTALLSLRGQRTLIIEPKNRWAAIDTSIIKRTLSWAQLDSIKVLSSIPLDNRHNSKVDYTVLRKNLTLKQTHSRGGATPPSGRLLRLWQTFIRRNIT